MTVGIVGSAHAHAHVGQKSIRLANLAWGDRGKFTSQNAAHVDWSSRLDRSAEPFALTLVAWPMWEPGSLTSTRWRPNTAQPPVSHGSGGHYLSDTCTIGTATGARCAPRRSTLTYGQALKGTTLERVWITSSPVRRAGQMTQRTYDCSIGAVIVSARPTAAMSNSH